MVENYREHTRRQGSLPIVRHAGMGAFRMWAMSEQLIVEAGSFEDAPADELRIPENKRSWGLVLPRDVWQSLLDDDNQQRLRIRSEHPYAYESEFKPSKILPWVVLADHPNTGWAPTQLAAVKQSLAMSGIQYPS